MMATEQRYRPLSQTQHRLLVVEIRGLEEERVAHIAALEQISGKTGAWPGGDWRDVAYWMRDRAAHALASANEASS